MITNASSAPLESKPNVEGIQEVTVQTNNYAAEVGRTAGGVVNIVTRSGTNAFHGSVYEFFRNNIFDARNVFQTTGNQPELRQNQYGGSIGGPVLKNKMFFYFDYEGFRQVSGVTDTGTVPTLDEYNDINSLNGGSPQALLSKSNGTLTPTGDYLTGAKSRQRNQPTHFGLPEAVPGADESCGPCRLAKLHNQPEQNTKLQYLRSATRLQI